MPVSESQRLYKARGVHDLGSKVAFNYDDLRKQCDEYVEQVRQQAARMIADSQSQAEAIRRQAQAEARAEGQREGLREASQLIESRATELANQKTAEHLRTTMPVLEAAVAALQVERDRWLAWCESAPVRLSVAIAEKIIRHELARKPEFIPRLITEALALAAGDPALKIRMHPRDIEQLRACGHDIMPRLAPLGHATLVPDEQMARGGCLIETTHGVIDARLETQLARITAELLEGN